MPLALADAKIKLLVSKEEPGKGSDVKVSDLADMLRADERINKADYKMTVSGNSSVSETELCNKGEGQAPGPASYDVSVTPFWYLDDDGNPLPEEMEVYELFCTPGTELWLVEIKGPSADVPPAEGNMFKKVKVVTGDPQDPSDLNTGYIKSVVPLFVLDWKTGVLGKA